MRSSRAARAICGAAPIASPCVHHPEDLGGRGVRRHRKGIGKPFTSVIGVRMQPGDDPSPLTLEAVHLDAKAFQVIDHRRLGGAEPYRGRPRMPATDRDHLTRLAASALAHGLE